MSPRVEHRLGYLYSIPTLSPTTNDVNINITSLCSRRIAFDKYIQLTGCHIETVRHAVCQQQRGFIKAIFQNRPTCRAAGCRHKVWWMVFRLQSFYEEPVPIISSAGEKKTTCVALNVNTWTLSLNATQRVRFHSHDYRFHRTKVPIHAIHLSLQITLNRSVSVTVNVCFNHSHLLFLSNWYRLQKSHLV